MAAGHRSILVGACLAVAVISPAHAAQKTCHIVMPVGQWSTELYQHEMAHCNGWKHPEVPKGKRAYEVEGYKAYVPPPELTHLYPGPIEIRFMPMKKAIKACDRLSYACAWLG